GRGTQSRRSRTETEGHGGALRNLIAMSGVDEEFLHRLRATFELEANDHLQVITSNLVALEVGSGSDTSVEHIELMFRSAHSLKGAARAVALNDVESICQNLEGLFADWKGVDGVPDARALDRAHALVDQITGYLRAARPDKEATGTSVSVRGGSGSGSLAAAQPSAGG